MPAKDTWSSPGSFFFWQKCVVDDLRFNRFILIIAFIVMINVNNESIIYWVVVVVCLCSIYLFGQVFTAILILG